MKKIVLMVVFVLLLSSFAFASDKVTEDEIFDYFDRTKQAMWSIFSDPENATPMPYGLPVSYCPDEVFAVAEKSLFEINNIGTSFPDEAPNLHNGIKEKNGVELVGGYQVLIFRDNNKILSSDGRSIIDTGYVGDIWVFILYINGFPTGIVQIGRIPEAPEYQMSSFEDAGGDVIAHSLISFAEGTRGLSFESPVFIKFKGRKNCVVTARTSEGDKGLISFEKNPQVYDVTYIIGFEQQMIKQERLLAEDSSINQGNSLSYQDFVPTPVEKNSLLKDYWMAPVIILVIVIVGFFVQFIVRKNRITSGHSTIR